MRTVDVDASAPTVGGHTADLLDRPAPTVKANSSHEGTGDRPGRRGMTDVARAMGGLLDRPARTLNASEHKGSLNLPARGGTKDDRRASTSIIAALAVESQPSPVRMTVAQLAALQSFPAGFVFHGTTTAQHRQCGNAVPPLLARALGVAIHRALYGAAVRSEAA
jgi:site-specific DNA-cytosine methylase